MKRVWILMLSCAATAASAAQVGNDLPDMGNPVDAIITRSELPAMQVLSTLTILEMRKLIRRVSGMQYVRL